ncbi:hypothetical protein H0H92_013422 [Tricholoma furcatifolium]|nr:hypothetical protein H0H92_013422 [Tricholoma furcatifolium]
MSTPYRKIAPITLPFSQPVTALSFDPVSDVLWVGSNIGDVTGYYGTRGVRGVSFQVGGSLAVKRIIAGDNHVRALGLSGDGFGTWAKGGMNKCHPSNITTFSNTSNSNVVAASTADMELLYINSITGVTLRQTTTPSVINHLQASHTLLLSGSSDGYLRTHDPRSNSSRSAETHVLPKRASTISIASNQGLVNIVDVTNPGAVSEFYQVSRATKPSLSSATGAYMAFGDAEGVIHLLSQAEDESDVPFNGFDGQPVEWADTPEALPEIEWTEATPLNTVGLPHYDTQLLSAWTASLAPPAPFYPPPPKIPAQLLHAMKMKDNISYAALPKELKGRRNMISVEPQKNNGRFRSGKSSKKEIDPSTPAYDYADGEIPRMYRRVEIEYSKFGVEDFDFGARLRIHSSFYNKTDYSGLETHILNSYTNPVLQVMHYSLPIRALAKTHITTNCRMEHCLLCELGFVVRMLEDAKGTNCQSSNFCKTVGVLALELNAIELIDYGRNSLEVDYAHKIQIFHRFLIDRLNSEGNAFPNNLSLLKSSFNPLKPRLPVAAPLTQLLGIRAKNIITCGNCGAVRENDNLAHLVELTYPRKGLANETLPAKDFASVLRYSLFRQTTHKSTCRHCSKSSLFTTQRSILSEDLPPILAINACISSNDENLDLWLDSRGQSFLPSSLRLHGQVSGMDDQSAADYIIRALVVQVMSKDESHLVAIVRVPEADGRPELQSPWFIFNDFVVRNISEEEALSFPGRWKVPAIIHYERSNLSDVVDCTKLPRNIDETILCHDTSISLNRDPQLVKHEVLQPSELPHPGTLVAIDAEFVSMQQEETEFRSDGTKKVLRPARLSLARVSVLRGDGPKQGCPFIDDHIHTSEVIVDYLTEFSGIRFGDLDPHLSPHTLTPLKLVYKKLRLLVDRGCVFIGHGLSKDFRIINIYVPPSQIIDTVDLYFLKSRQRRLSLRFLSWFVLHENIQTETHDSIEDARSALHLYKAYNEFKEDGTLPQKLDELYAEGRLYNYRPPQILESNVLEAERAASPGYTLTQSDSISHTTNLRSYLPNWNQ